MVDHIHSDLVCSEVERSYLVGGDVCGRNGRSVFRNAKPTDHSIDIEDSTFVHWTAGASRAAIGVIAGAICYLAIKSGIALTFATKAEDLSGVFFFCCLSGFSETFVPNLLKNHEKDADSTGGASHGKNGQRKGQADG